MDEDENEQAEAAIRAECWRAMRQTLEEEGPFEMTKEIAYSLEISVRTGLARMAKYMATGMTIEEAAKEVERRGVF